MRAGALFRDDSCRDSSDMVKDLTSRTVAFFHCCLHESCDVSLGCGHPIDLAKGPRKLRESDMVTFIH